MITRSCKVNHLAPSRNSKRMAEDMNSTRRKTIWRFLGEPRISGPEGDLTDRLGRKHLALLAYLALHPDGVSREAAAAMLWPAAEPARAKHSLRQCLVGLRKVFGEADGSPLTVTEQSLALDSSRVAVDALLLADLADRDAPPADDLLDLCRGPFLRGFASRARPFDTWAAAQRARLGSLAGQALRSALGQAERSGNRTAAARLAATLAELQPGPEPHPATAPQPITVPRRIGRRLALATGAGMLLAGALLAAHLAFDRQPPSIAVRPFEPVSASPQALDLARGLTTNVTHALHGVSARDLLVVTAGADAPELRGLPVPELARELGVDYLMVGEVRVEAGRAEVKVQLLDGKTGKLVDSDHVVEVVEQTNEISRLEDELTRHIIESLDIELSDAEWNRIALIDDTASLDAWIAATKGLSHLIKVTRRDVDVAEAYYRQALAFDPDYVSALRGLAWCEFLRARLGWKPPMEAGPEIMWRMQRVLAERPDDPTTISLRGAVRLFQRDYEGAVADGARAVTDLPNSADVHAIYAHTLTFVGEYDQALDEIGEAMKRSPLTPHWYHWVRGRALRMAGRHDEAIRELEINLAPDQPLVAQRVELAAAYAAAERMIEARRIARRITDLSPGFTIAGWQQTVRIRDDEPRERERDLLRAAGLPD